MGNEKLIEKIEAVKKVHSGAWVVRLIYTNGEYIITESAKLEDNPQ